MEGDYICCADDSGVWQIVLAATLSFLFAVAILLFERFLTRRSTKLEKLKSQFSQNMLHINKINGSLGEALIVLSDNIGILEAKEKNPIFIEDGESTAFNIHQPLLSLVTLEDIGSLEIFPIELSIVWIRIRQLTNQLNSRAKEFNDNYSMITNLIYNQSSHDNLVFQRVFQDNTNRDIAKIANEYKDEYAELRDICVEFICFSKLYNRKYSSNYLKKCSKSYKKFNHLIDEAYKYKPNKASLKKSFNEFNKNFKGSTKD